jgi:hypothetical protein
MVRRESGIKKNKIDLNKKRAAKPFFYLSFCDQENISLILSKKLFWFLSGAGLKFEE